MGSFVFSLCFASMKDNEHWSEQKEKRMMMDLNKHSQIVLMSQTVRTFIPSLLVRTPPAKLLKPAQIVRGWPTPHKHMIITTLYFSHDDGSRSTPSSTVLFAEDLVLASSNQ